VTGGLVSCTVGTRQFAMRGADVREIVRAERMRPSGRSDGSTGTLVVAGNSIPVYSLGAVLDNTTASSASGAAGTDAAPSGHHIVVTHGSQGPIGWLADRIVRSHLTERFDVLPLPFLTSVSNGWFEGVLIVEGSPLLLVSPRRLDPRVARDRTHSDAAIPETDAPAAPPSVDAGPPLVVMFSSPALPPSGAPRYALSARRIAAVVQSLDVTPVPGCPPHVTGVAVWRGMVMPVIDFRPAGERTTAIEGTRFLIARCGRTLRGGSVAFAVDSELGLHKPTAEDREADGDDSTPSFIAGTFNVLGDRLALLDLDALLCTIGAQ